MIRRDIKMSERRIKMIRRRIKMSDRRNTIRNYLIFIKILLIRLLIL